MSNNHDIVIKIDDSTAKSSVEENKLKQSKKQINIPKKYNPFSDETIIKNKNSDVNSLYINSKSCSYRLYKYYSSSFYFFLLHIFTFITFVNFTLACCLIYLGSELVKYQYNLNIILILFICIHFILRVFYKRESYNELKQFLFDFFICFDLFIFIFGLFIIYKIYKSLSLFDYLTDSINILIYVLFSLLILVRFIIHLYIKKKRISEDNINTKHVQDIINFTEQEQDDKGKEKKENVTELDKSTNEYKQTPQGSGFEETLKVDKGDNLIIDKLKERNSIKEKNEENRIDSTNE